MKHEKKVYQNPLVWTDIPDMDVIRVNDIYYMTSTTMHFVPGVPVMKSYDLINWNIVNYVYDELSDSDDMTLSNGKHAYGKGSWASSLRYHKGMYYVSFLAYNTGKTYIYQTNNIENGVWDRCIIDGLYHDMSLLFDDDGRVYMVYGGGKIQIVELESNLSGLKENGLNQVIIENADVAGKGGLNAEGAHIHKLDGKYYIFLIAWPPGKFRTEVCYRSNNLTGPYDGRVVLHDDMGRSDGVAQGGLIDTKDGKWYALLFQDTASVGRIPVLVPVEWKDGWPVFGVDGRVPNEAVYPVQGYSGTNIVVSDDFDSNKLSLTWQWNHNPVNDCWSLDQRRGYLRLITSKISKNILEARNTLTQRTFGPECTGVVSIDVNGMKDGDVVGLAVLQERYGYVGVHMKNGEKAIVMCNAESGEEKEISRVPLKFDTVYLKVMCDFRNKIDLAYFYYSIDGEYFEKIGDTLHMKYLLSHFVGYRFALFCYATENIGGYADFDYFKLKPPTL